LRLALRIIGWFLVLLVLTGGGFVWWLVLRPLPQVDGSASLPGLQNPVTVDRDIWAFRTSVLLPLPTWQKPRDT